MHLPPCQSPHCSQASEMSKSPVVRVRHPSLARAIWPREDGRIRAISALIVLALGPGLSGCILGSERPELNLEVPEKYRAASSAGPDAAPPVLDWWRGFGSSELTSLMDAAQISNLDIAVAIAQVVQADAQVGVAGAPLLPSLTGAASAERAHFGSTSSGSNSSSNLGGGVTGT